ncbi:MAG TPA: DegT/DnrJ/EryC1/StrS family aminotransferase [Streptosporangiaceae bacterium]|jgi:dTDP-4-amino-4,6-dideoxygalactose transaminase
MIPLLKSVIAPDALDRVAEVFGSGHITHGPKVDEFEEALRGRIGNPRLATVNNGTSGLHLAVRLATDPELPGEVLSTPYTFEATNWAILANGLSIRWVDVDPETLNVDLDDLARKITPATRAIVVVHWAGYPVDLDRLREIVDDAESAHGRRPMIIEDCAHAWGATYQGMPLGNHGNFSVFSFGPSKILTCGAGGLIVVPDDESYRRARLLRRFGIGPQSDPVNRDYDVAEWGYNFYMIEINAAIGRANLDPVDDALRLHRENAAFYDKELADVPGLEHTERADDRKSSFYLYPVKVDDRPAFMRKLTDAGIGTSVVARRNDAHRCMGTPAVTLPGLDSIQDRVAYIPVGWWLSEEDRAHIVDTIRSGW